MNELSKNIISNFMVRKSGKQKREFRNYIINELKAHNYNPKVDNYGNSIIQTNNIIVGDINSCKVLITAHYDTQPTLGIIPNFITPKNKLIYIIYQAILTFLIVAVGIGIPMAFYYGFKINSEYKLLFYFIGFIDVILISFILMFGKANKHTYNDNTSGVVTLTEILLNLHEEDRNKVCAVFFDNEEIGLVGSKFFYKRNKKIVENKLLLNFDCVSDGDHFLFVYNKIEDKELLTLKNSFTDANKEFEFISKNNAIYPSDQRHFKKGIGICALKYNKILGHYMDRIHTRFDTKFDELNIKALQEGLINYVRSVDDEKVSL